MPEQTSIAMRGLGWVLAAMGVALLAHVRQLPAWASVSLLVAASWRYAAAQRGWALPPRWVRTLAAIGALLFVLAIFRTVNGVQAGTALLAMMAAVKLLETRTERDLTVLVFIAYFLLYAALLRDQGITRLPLLLAGALRRDRSAPSRAWRRRRRGARQGARTHGGACLARAAARAAAVRALPAAARSVLGHRRRPGSRTGLERRNHARRRLGPERLGRGRVSGPLRRTDPAAAQRYWRGPVLHEFDGRRWRRPLAQTFPQQIRRLDRRAGRLPDHPRAARSAMDTCARPAGSVARARGAQHLRLSARRAATDHARDLVSLRSYPRLRRRRRASDHRCATATCSFRPTATRRPLALGRELARRHSDPMRHRRRAAAASSATSSTTTRSIRRGSPTTRSTSSCSRRAAASASTTPRPSRS